MSECGENVGKLSRAGEQRKRRGGLHEQMQAVCHYIELNLNPFSV
jgi:hypothetical protein